MNGQATPHLDDLVTSGPEQAGPEAGTKPRADAALPPKARSIAGVYVEASGQTQSVYTAMKQGLLPAELGLALLEAQAATGGLVDPAHGRLFPVSAALRQGLVGLELKEKLLAAERAVTGYPDPYGGGKLALFQAIGKEVVDRPLGRSWLEAQLATGGVVDPAQGVRVAPELACQQGLLDRETWQSLEKPERSTDAPGFLDPGTLERLPYRVLLDRCIRAPGSGLALLPLQPTFRTLGGAAGVAQLQEAGVLPEEVARGLRDGTLAVSAVSARPEVQRYLEGTGSVAGLVLLPGGHRKSFFQASAEHLLPMGAVLPLLEAQAATHTLVDPATGRRLGVDEAVRVGLVGPELHEQLLVAEQAVTGFHDPFSSSRIPLFQAMKKELVDRPLALRLLDAQLATGGLICPARRFRLPLDAALRLGCLDEETLQCLSQARSFSDPSTQASLAYGQLLAHCVTDPETGLALLPLSGGAQGDALPAPVLIEPRTRQALSEATTSVSTGKFRGRPASLWELLFSEAVPPGQRAKLAQRYQEGALSSAGLAAELRACIEQAAAPAGVAFAGLRDSVTAGELLEAAIIDRELYEKLEGGQASAGDVGSLDSVRRYLRGTGCIAGLLLPGSRERLSIYQARSQGLLRPGTALVLLEAQAATGFVIDPRANKSYSVEEALKAGVIGPDVYMKLLSAERAVTGYTDPATGERLSLFQAMQKDLIVREHGLRLLEAQIATGGIIDPVHSHRVPVDVAYQRGYFDQMLNVVLADPSDDTKGFFDPNTHENLTYLQLLERCVEDPDTGLRLLPLSGSRPPLVDGSTRQAFQNLLLSVRYGRFRGRSVSAWDLVNSEYFSEARRRQLLQSYGQRKVSLERVAQLLEGESRRWAGVTVPALRGRVPVHQLLETRIIDQELLSQVLAGTVSPDTLLRTAGVHRFLQGSGTVGGVLLRPSNRRLSLYQAMRQKLLAPGVALSLLEAQAATGALRDPGSPTPVSVDEAVRRGLVGPEVHRRLRRAEEALAGVRDPFSGKRVPLFQATRRGLVSAELAARLLEAQVATGGPIDPARGLHLPMPVAIQCGCIDQETAAALSSSPKTFPTPDGRGCTSYAQLLEQCPRDEATGLHLLPLEEGAPAVPTDSQLQETLRATPGTEDGVSLWQLLSSGHFTEEQRAGFLEDLRAGRTSVPELQAAVCRQVREAALLTQARVAVPGPRGGVPAAWLRDAGVISQEELAGLAGGTRSPAEVAQQPMVKACLWGTGCVAGVLLQPSGTKASIAQAVRDGLLPAGVGRRLLEAQVASGALVDPLTNQRLSVEDAVKAGLVGGELREPLLQAQRAVAGYTDPYSGGSLSLWQAMEKGLVSQGEGAPLLQVQLATGGVVDPAYGVHLPQAAACRLGLLDERTSQALTAREEDNKFFFDPSARDQVTYQQLKERCAVDPATGLRLLPLHQDAVLAVDEHTAVALRAMKVPVSAGRFQGHSVSLWDLLHSEYVGADKRQELAALCRSGRATALRQVVSAVTALVEASEGRPTQAAFRGLRKQVSARDLFRSQLINKQTLDELDQGKKTVQEVSEMDSVRRSLEGGNFIAGVLVQATKEKMSIPEALRRHILRPGTALVLLEAQAATGFIIDPVENRKLTVEQAFEAGMFGRETYTKLLSAERAVTGYTDPATGEQISLFQAMQKDLIVREHGIRLLEAQIATGGIIDPVHSHRLPVDVAYQRGYFDEEMSRVLADPSDDTKGFFDPNTHENLTYLQLLGRCVEDPDTGLYMLQIVKKGETYTYIDEATKQSLRSRTVKMHVGRFAGEMVSVWELLSSPYFTEKRKRELVREYAAQSSGLEKLLQVITTTIEETEKQNQDIKVAAIHGDVTAAELFNAGIVDGETLDALHSSQDAGRDLRHLEQVSAYLDGSGCIAGVMAPFTREVMSLHEAGRRGHIPAGFAAQLLEAQAATGFLLDPCAHRRLSVGEALAAGLVGEDLRERLEEAERAARGYADPATGEPIPLFQAMKKRLLRREEALRLLEVQVATGGVVDPRHHHRLPLDTAYRRGCLDEDTHALVADQKLMKKRFVDPNTQERVTYRELQDRCQREQKSGWALFPVVKDARDAEYVDEQTRRALEAEQVEITVGRYRGQRRSVWDLLNSEYVTEEKKRELVRTYKGDTAQALGKVVKVILQMIADKEKSSKRLWFRGIRKQVTAEELLGSAVITPETLAELEDGRSTVDRIQGDARVKRYLQGTSCIAGVLVPARGEPGRQEKMSIYQAMWKGVLRPGTALVLLEAQAATGFVIDPVHNRRLSVEEAVAAGVVGGEIREKLLSAERAVTGYTDPYTGEQLSLFQAMQKDLIVREHGLRLLEAQIATGGIVDPVHSHRLPVDVAYQRGYFDEEMSRVLADPSDDTKGFFDPNTHENLTYLQLLGRCVEDPDTGLYMLQLAGPGSALHGLSEAQRRALRDARVALAGGPLRGQSVSVWELLFQRAVPEGLRQDLLRQYGAGTRSVQDVSATLAALMALRSATMEVRAGRLRGRAVPVWDVLVSSYVSKTAREQLLSQFQSGTLALPALTRRLTAIVEEAEEVQGPRPKAGRADSGPQDHGSSGDGARSGSGLCPGKEGDRESSADRQEQALRSATMEVRAGRLRGRAVPVWDVLVSSYVSKTAREQLLAQFQSGRLALPALTRRLTAIVEEAKEAEEAGGAPPESGRQNVGQAQPGQQDPGPSRHGLDGGSGPFPGPEDGAEASRQEQALRAAPMEVCVGQFRGQRVSVWDVLWSSYLGEARRGELLARHAAGSLGLPGLVGILTQTVEDTEARLSKVSFRGLRRQVSASELGSSGVLGPETLRALAQGTKTLQEVTEMDSVKRYLQGTSCIAGVLVPARGEPGRQEKMSIYQAMWKGVLRPGTALVLLEAQAATGFVIDPVHNRRLSVEEAVAAGVVGGEIREKLLSAERAVTGYTDPYTGEQLSLFQAMQKDLIVREHGLRLLEAQIATGGIVDPVHSHRVPVDVAYQRGYFDEEMSRVLADPSDDTKGFFDPNTHENLTYLQLLGRCVEDPDTGLYMLQLAEEVRGPRPKAGRADSGPQDPGSREDGAHNGSGPCPGKEGDRESSADRQEQALRSATMEVRAGRLRGRAVPVWDVLASGYVSTDTREQLLAQFQLGTLALPALTRRLIAIIEEAEEVQGPCPKAGRADSGPQDHGSSGDGAHSSSGPCPGVEGDHESSADRQEQALRSATMEVRAGRLRGRAVPVWDVLVSSYVSKTAREQLLAQFQSGRLALPALTRRLTAIVEEAEEAEEAGGAPPESGRQNVGQAQPGQQDPGPSRHGLDGGSGPFPGPEDGAEASRQEQALRAAPMEVRVGQFRGQRVSVWDVLWSSYLGEARRGELLARHAAGSLGLPGLVGILTQTVEDTEARLSKVSFRGLRRQVSASELGSSGVLGPETLRALAQGTKTLQEVTEMDSVKRYLQGTSCIAGVLVPARGEPGRQEKMSIYQAMWKGVLRPGTALVLLEAQAATGFVIDPVHNRRLSVEEAVAAGVVGGEIREKLLLAERAVTGYTDPYTGEQLSLFQAMQKDLIVREHGLRLLEAQIATGGIVDPVHSHRLPVDVAYQRGYFDEEMSRVLADPSDDTKGFFDPNTHENLTYLQLLGRCVEDPDTGLYMLQLAGPGSALHGLSEAQRRALRDARVALAGGPLRGQSVSVWELLFQRAVPEGLRQDLLRQYGAGTRSVQDVSATLAALMALRSATMEVRAGRLRGRAVPVWDVLASGYVSTDTREQLLAQFQSGTLALPVLTRRLTAIIEEAEEAEEVRGPRPKAGRADSGPQDPGSSGDGARSSSGPCPGEEGDRQSSADGQEQALRSATMEVRAGRLRGRAVPVWDVLVSSYVSKTAREQLLAQFQSGRLALPALTCRLTAIVEEAEEVQGPRPKAGRADSGPQDPGSSEDGARSSSGPCPGVEGDHESSADRQEQALRSATMEVRAGRLRGRAVPVWDVLVSSYVSKTAREQLLAQFQSGRLALPALTRRLTAIVEEAEEAEEAGGAPPESGRQNVGQAQPGQQDPGPSRHGLDGGSGPFPGPEDGAEASRQEQALRAAPMEVCVGQFRGQRVSVWDVLWSSYLGEARRGELLARHAAGSLGLPGLVGILTQTVEDTEAQLSKVSFRGLRRQVSASELGSSGVLGPETLRALAQGTKTLQEVTEMDSVKRYLQGTSCIAGVLVPARGEPGRQEKMSIYQAMWKGVLRPGTALVLLEAQAATGFVIDPVHNRRLSVEEAVAAGVVGGEIREKLLSAERAVTGYTDPYTGEQLSLFQAMQKDLIVREHGLRLLEAQIATGGIVDPVHSHRLPVDVAYQRGYFDEEMSRVLADPSDDTKGFFDPNTHENLTYLQLLGRCVEDPDTGLYMLQLAGPGSALHGLSEAQRRALRDARVVLAGGPLRGQSVSVWELLFQRAVPEGLRQDLLRQYGAGTRSVQDVSATLAALMALRSATMEVRAGRLRGRAVPVWDVLVSSYVSKTAREQLLAQFQSGTLALPALTRRLTAIVEEAEEVQGPRPKAGRADSGPQDPGSSGDGARSGSGLCPGKEGDRESSADRQEQALRSATMEVRAGRLRGRAVPVWDVLVSSYVSKTAREQLLAQFQSGRLALPALTRRLTAIVEEAKEAEEAGGAPPESGRQNVGQAQPGQQDPGPSRHGLDGGSGPFPGPEDGAEASRQEQALRAAPMEVRVGQFRGQRVSVWDVLWSSYLGEARRGELLARHAAGSLGLPGLVGILTQTVEDTEARLSKVSFRGLRRQVSASELGSSGVLGPETLRALAQGTKTLQEVTEMDSVKRYLQGTSCIAGVLVPARGEPGRQEKMSIYQAMWKGVLRPGTALVLLEAQAATGFVIDPVHNRRLSVEEAVAAGVVGGEIREKLLSAERAVTGYTDPYTGEQLSLFQAMQKDLIVREHGLRLLEAQIATGGIVDPVHSHRVPVDVAYQRGYFDEEMSRVLADPSDDTKGFFDPNTHENLTYLQLLGRCVEDPDTGLYMLQLAEEVRGPRPKAGRADSGPQDPGSREDGAHNGSGPCPGKEGDRESSADRQEQALRSATMEVRAGRLRGRAVPVWDVLASGYVSTDTREQLLAQFQLGTLALPALTRRLIAIIEEAEEVQGPCPKAGRADSGPQDHGSSGDGAHSSSGPCPGVEGDHESSADRQEQALRSATMEVRAGRLRGRAVPVWDVLVSSYVSKTAREQLLAQFQSGRLALPALTRRLTAIVEEAEEAEEAGGAPPESGRQNVGQAQPGQQDPGPSRHGLDGGSGPFPGPEDGAEASRQEQALRAAPMEVRVGQFRGQRVSVWDVLWSSYLGEARRGELLARHAAGSLGLPGLVGILTQTVEDTEARLSKVSFRGLRRQVSASELGSSGVLGPETLRALAQGTKTLQEVTEMDSVKRYLQGTSCIAGVLVPARGEPGRQEKMSIYQAMWKGVLRPGTALVLLEAQAATGFVIDPVHNRRLSVEEAVAAGVVGGEIREKLLLAERAVTGYTDPYTGEQLSLFQAMQKDLIVREHGLRLLEAQIATGGIVDPVHSHRLPVDVAYQRGYFDEEMSRVLADPSDDTKGFFDPNTHENLTYLQLLGRCVEDPDTGLYMLQLAGPGSALHGLSEAQRRALRDARVALAGGPLRGQSVSVWELLFQRAVPEGLRQDLLRQYGAGTRSVQDVSATLAALMALRSATMEVRAGRLRGRAVPVWDVLASGYVSTDTREQLLAQFQSGTLALPVLTRRLTAIIEEAEEAEEVRGPRPKAGRADSGPQDPGSSGDGARSSSGPCPGEEGDRQSSADGQEQALRSATMEVRAGRLRGRAVPVWDVLVSSYVSKTAREQLLAQFQSGRLALPALTRRLTAIVEEAEEAEEAGGAPPESGRQNVGQAQPGQQDPGPSRHGLDGGSGPFPGPEDGAEASRQEQALRAAPMEVRVGQFRGQRVSVWDVLWSSYLGEARRGELLARHAAGSLGLPGLVGILTQTVEDTEARLSKVSFRGLRRQVSASELGSSGVLGPETLRALAQGTKTLQEVTEMDSVKRYLQGTSCIAGVLVPARGEPGRQEKMSIYQAMWKGVLRPGTALVLLEAQAATGFVIDPVHNRRLSVEEAVAAGVVGGEIREKLLSAERAVTGYTDPYTGEQLSLFQAMQKDLIVREHGLRLLEAQIATGGIVDPVHSHRLPVDVAYQRGYFDEEMSRVLADPSDDTKGFFDPNTHENLTYLQLLGRCVEDPDTGLYMLQLAGPGSALHGLSEAQRRALRDARVALAGGPLRGQSVSVWELLFQRAVPEGLRQDLLRQYGAGTRSVQDVGATLAALMALRSATMEVRAGRLRGRAVPVWDVLASGYVSTDTREQLLAQFQSGTLALPALTRRLTAIVEEAEEVQGPRPKAGQADSAPQDPGSQEDGAHNGSGPCPGKEGDRESSADRQEQALRSATMEVRAGRLRGRAVPVWDVLVSSYVSKTAREQLLAQFQSGRLALPTLTRRLTAIVEEAEEAEEAGGAPPESGRQNVGQAQPGQQDPGPSRHGLDGGSGPFPGPEDGAEASRQEQALRAAPMEVRVGQFRGQRVSVWDVLWSSYLGEARRGELLARHAAGSLGLPGLVGILTQTVEDTEAQLSKVSFRGLRRQVSASELGSSGVLGPKTLRALAQGTKTLQEVTEMDSVKRYLQGTSCIAGVLVPARGEPGRQEKMSIYQAMWKGVLRPGTALVLLEAQAATGFVIDPVHNRRLSVEEAVAAGVVGGEIREKLLSAERAVTGYTDPYTGEQLSLFQAMQKDLIVREHGLRLLEAQIATGGIVDPVHSHRVPVDVAYQRGYFDEEMSRVLSDPSDDTKGFFDPNTHENLTYLQLLERATLDPETGLLFLSVSCG